MNLKKEIYNNFKSMNICCFATSANSKPAVRPVTIIFFRDKFWLATGTSDNKMKQISQNKNVEFCLTISGEDSQGYIRVSGIAEKVSDIPTKKLIADNFEYIKHFWTEPDAPGYALLEIVPNEIEYLKLGEMIAQRYNV
jgi:uncharacterized pyridoxamine 5'-phosphate oxidase family protein